MPINRLKVSSFRNLAKGEIKLDAPVVYFIGENGQGKTNLLEAIYLVCYGSSFRTRINRRIIKHGDGRSRVNAAVTFNDGLEHDVDVIIYQHKKEIRIDEKAVGDRIELVENIPCIVFSHDDMVFTRGSPDKKRWFLDQTISLCYPGYIYLLREYRKILKHRNSSLLGRTSEEILSILDEQLGKTGLELQKKRRQVMNEINVPFSLIFNQVSDLADIPEIEYKPSWKDTQTIDDVCAFLKERRKKDREMSFTSSGPHRDTFIFRRNGKDFTQFASTGQIRLLSLVLRRVQAMYYSEITGKKPLFLIDDVLLELDGEKRRRFFDLLEGYEQAFFTFLPEEHMIYSKKENTLKYILENGEWKGWQGQETY